MIRTRPVTLPLEGGQAQASVRLHPLLTAEVLTPPGLLHRPAGPLGQLRGLGLTTPRSRWEWAPVPAFLIEHPGAGHVLVDAGMHSSFADGGSGNLDRLSNLVWRFRMTASQALPEQLRARGLSASDVRTVVMTHLHVDHASGVSEFPDATFVVTRPEWEAATRRGPLRGYVAGHIDHPFDWRLLDPYGPASEPYEAFSSTVDLFGDGSVRLLFTPGHTDGHMAVLLRLADGVALLTGDAAYTQRTIETSAMPTLTADESRFRQSLAEIQRYVERSPDSLVITGHDAEAWPRLRETY